jgi:BlaI family penicillinase repressor
MAQKPISQAEWEVLNVLWDHPDATVRDISAILATSHGWNQKTVGTFLKRLTDKGMVTAKAEGRAFLYRTKISREKGVARESKSFLQRVFRGSVGPMLVHFCEQTDLTPAEIARLEKILESKKG